LKGAYVSFLICLIEIWRVIKQRGLKGAYVSFFDLFNWNSKGD
jgi:hypothetical protein